MALLIGGGVLFCLRVSRNWRRDSAQLMMTLALDHVKT